MSGNVWEWTRSHYKSYPYQAADGREELSADDYATRAIRGGAFYTEADWLRCACRDRLSPGGDHWGFGVRVCAAPISTSGL
jgi:formylglycine-generating enzyme required for sulfatase activity